MGEIAQRNMHPEGRGPADVPDGDGANEGWSDGPGGCGRRRLLRDRDYIAQSKRSYARKADAHIGVEAAGSIYRWNKRKPDMSGTRSRPLDSRRSRHRIGWMLICISVLSIAIAVQHPAPASASDAAISAVAAILAESAEIYSVHGTLILVMMLTAFGLVETFRTVDDNFRARFGIGLLIAGMTSMILAALVSGFSLPMFAGAVSGVDYPANDDSVRTVLFFASSLNRVFATLAVLADSAAMLVLASVLTFRSRIATIAGLFGAAAGLFSVLGLFFAWFEMDYSGFNLSNTLLYIWVALVGLWIVSTAREAHTPDGAG